jgi:hypothetical protein
MTEFPDQDTRVIAAMRLSGRRFDSEGMPADSLVEVAAFEDLIRSLARLYWFDRHPDRKRLPKGYDNDITLRLTSIAEGSAVPVLEHDSILMADEMFGPDEIKHDYKRAVSTIGDFITYGFADSGQIPDDIRRLPASKVKKFGQSMHRGEAIQVAAALPAEPAEWDQITRYTPDARSHALVGLVGSFTQRVKVEGQVIDFKVNTGQLVVRDRDHKGDIPIPYLESGVAVSIDSARQLFECEAEGIGEFSADGRLLRMASVSSLAVIDVTEDARIARASLDALADLDQGWVDGDTGQAVAPSVLERGRAVIDAMIALSNITRTVAPTEEGGVTFFWPDAENQLSIEVEPSGSLYVHITDLVAGTFADGKVAADVDNLTDALQTWLAEAPADD